MHLKIIRSLFGVFSKEFFVALILLAENLNALKMFIVLGRSFLNDLIQPFKRVTCFQRFAKFAQSVQKFYWFCLKIKKIFKKKNNNLKEISFQFYAFLLKISMKSILLNLVVTRISLDKIC